MMKSLTSLSLAALVGLTAAAASATDFEISTSPLSTASYTSDADLETISGTSVQVSGTIATDLKDPSKTSGTISIPVTSLLSGVPMRDEHMAGKDWLNAAEFPNITFAIKSLALKGDNKALTAGSSVQADATGEFTLHGVTKTITIPVTSLVSGVAMRDEHMAGKDWLNAAQFPNITFAIKSLKLKGDNKALTAGSSVQADATGEFTLHGVTKTITIPVRASYREIAAGQVYGLEGNILRIETTFGIKLSDYGVNIPAPLTAKVANELTLTVKATAKQK